MPISHNNFSIYILTEGHSAGYTGEPLLGLVSDKCFPPAVRVSRIANWYTLYAYTLSIVVDMQPIVGSGRSRLVE